MLHATLKDILKKFMEDKRAVIPWFFIEKGRALQKFVLKKEDFHNVPLCDSPLTFSTTSFMSRTGWTSNDHLSTTFSKHSMILNN